MGSRPLPRSTGNGIKRTVIAPSPSPPVKAVSCAIPPSYGRARHVESTCLQPDASTTVYRATEPSLRSQSLRSAHDLCLCEVALNPVDDPPRNADGPRNGARVGVPGEHVADRVQWSAIEARLASAIALRLGGPHVGNSGPLSLLRGFGLRLSAVAAMNPTSVSDGLLDRGAKPPSRKPI